MCACGARSEAAINRDHRNAGARTRIRQLRESGCGIQWSTRMSDIADRSSQPSTKRDEHTDKQTFAQVEKWMEMIREIDQERQTEHKRAD
jgi:hypothetical protein